MKGSYLVLLFLVLGTGINANAQTTPKREMRAVWIATVENIDWPSKPGLTSADQQQEMIELLDLVKAYHLNTIVLQIRPVADAFYPSTIEPWSHYLTGEQGKAPDPFYDPLAFTIAECRKRGLDIHVWLNPYRALRDTAVNLTAPDHITRTHPEWFVTYGSTVYFDPGLPQTRNHVACVVSDIVRRYDIDAIHMDDYFYPYRIAGVDFPDDHSFALYGGAFKPGNRDDWRRHNVDLIIQQIHDSIAGINPAVEFGISPFGVWRNIDKDSAGSLTRAGQTNYDDLFADILKWQKEGWIDYVVPQLYWQIGFKVADYAVLADWWNRNTFGCPLYIGQAFYRIDRKSQTKAWRSADEIIRQVNLNRTFPGIGGSMFFSAKYMRTNPLRLKQKLLKQVYPLPALPAGKPRLTPMMPDIPGEATLTKNGKTLELTWQKGQHTKNFILYKFSKGEPTDTSDPEAIYLVTSETSATININRKTKLSRYLYAITAQSFTNTESEPVFFELKNIH